MDYEDYLHQSDVTLYSLSLIGTLNRRYVNSSRKTIVNLQSYRAFFTIEGMNHKEKLVSIFEQLSPRKNVLFWAQPTNHFYHREFCKNYFIKQKSITAEPAAKTSACDNERAREKKKSDIKNRESARQSAVIVVYCHFVKDCSSPW